MDDYKKKNPMKPTIARKSINLASLASTKGEYKRPSSLSQQEHANILT